MRSKSPKQFCADHNMSPPTFYAEVAARRLRTFKVGRSRKISEAAEAEWIERGEAEVARELDASTGQAA